MVEEAERDRPNHALAGRAAEIDIAHLHAPLVANGFADIAQVDHRRRQVHGRRDDQAGGFQLVGHVLGEHRDDLGQGILRRLAQPVIAAIGHPAHAEHQGFKLFLAEHQGRQHVAGAQHIADTRLAFDVRALGLQRGDVAVEGAQRDFQLAGQFGARHRIAMAAQQLKQVKQSSGARHGRQTPECAVLHMAPT